MASFQEFQPHAALVSRADASHGQYLLVNATGQSVWAERIGGKYAASPVYADGRLGGDLGSSAAQSVVLMVIVIALTAIQFRYVERRVQY